MPTASEEAPERQPRNPNRTPAPPALRTSPSAGRREGFQNLVVMVFFPILDPATGGQVPDGARGCTAPVTSTTSGAAMGIEHVQVSVR